MHQGQGQHGRAGRKTCRHELGQKGCIEDADLRVGDIPRHPAHKPAQARAAPDRARRGQAMAGISDQPDAQIHQIGRADIADQIIGDRRSGDQGGNAARRRRAPDQAPDGYAQTRSKSLCASL